MTSAEIKKALEKAINEYAAEDVGSPEYFKLIIAILDLFNRQQAEVEKLKDSRDRWKRNALSFDEASRETEKELEKLYAEIERLNGCVKSEDEVRAIAKVTIQAGIGIIKAEAIKECLGKIEQIDVSESDEYIMVKKNRFDSLKNEMVGDAE